MMDTAITEKGETMRLIDADALIDELGISDEDIIFEGMLVDAPTIDAVTVVRCKDCKWWTKQEKSIQGRCALYGMYPTGGWYCANGRRDDE